MSQNWAKICILSVKALKTSGVMCSPCCSTFHSTNELRSLYYDIFDVLHYQNLLKLKFKDFIIPSDVVIETFKSKRNQEMVSIKHVATKTVRQMQKILEDNWVCINRCYIKFHTILHRKSYRKGKRILSV